MVKLDKETIETIKKVSDALEGTPFELNRFEVFESGLTEEDGIGITIDIRRKQ